MPSIEVLSQRLQPIEEEYRAAMVCALRDCASGRWGLFGQNKHLLPKGKLPQYVEELVELARSINAVRKRVGLEPFAMHERFLAMRGRPTAANGPGEPRQAQAWLEELGEA